MITWCVLLSVHLHFVEFLLKEKFSLELAPKEEATCSFCFLIIPIYSHFFWLSNSYYLAMWKIALSFYCNWLILKLSSMHFDRIHILGLKLMRSRKGLQKYMKMSIILARSEKRHGIYSQWLVLSKRNTERKGRVLSCRVVSS